MTVVHFGLSVLPIWTAIGPPWVRPCRMPPDSVTSSCSKDIRAPRPCPSPPLRREGRPGAGAVPEPAAGQLQVEVGGLPAHPGREALEEGGELLAVPPTGGQPAQHAGDSASPPARARSRRGKGARGSPD